MMYKSKNFSIRHFFIKLFHGRDCEVNGGCSPAFFLYIFAYFCLFVKAKPKSIVIFSREE